MVEKWIKEKMEQMTDRREFLKLMGALGIGLTPLVIVPSTSEMIFGRDLAQANKTRPLMGTFVNVTVLDNSGDRATEAMEAAFAEIERLISLLDRHSQDTPVAYLNRMGHLKDIAPEIHEVMYLGEHIHRLTGGMFDITVKPVLDLFEKHFSRTSEPPPAAEVQMVIKQVGAQYIRHGQDEIRFFKDGMGITLDGIAKGYIVDQAISLLKSRGIKHALINAGGDIRALGDKGRGRPWKIAIQDPIHKNKVMHIIPLQGRALATSGNYENYFDPEKKFHHIINPETGLSPQTFTSVSVLASSLAKADALATAAFIPAWEKAQEFIQAVPGTEALWIDRNKATVKTEGLRHS